MTRSILLILLMIFLSSSRPFHLNLSSEPAFNEEDNVRILQVLPTAQKTDPGSEFAGRRETGGCDPLDP